MPTGESSDMLDKMQRSGMKFAASVETIGGHFRVLVSELRSSTGVKHPKE